MGKVTVLKPVIEKDLWVTEKELWAIRLLRPEKIKNIIFNGGRAYADLGDLSDYKTIITPNGDVINAAEILEEKIIGYIGKCSTKAATPFKPIRIGSGNVLYAVVTFGEIRPYICFGILCKNEMYEGGEELIRKPLTLSLHTHQKRLCANLYAIYDGFADYVLKAEFASA